jgi:predicted nucleic acid-binding protein
MKNKMNLLPLNIQMFADPDPQQELDDLIKEVSGEEKKVEPVVETKTDPEVEKKTDPEVEKKTEEKTTEEETTEEDDEDDEEQELGEDGKPKKSSIKELRDSYKAEKKKAKELELQRQKLETDNRTVKEKLLKAIKLGIKGETEEEILQNLDNHEVKEEASKSGLTEEQVRKEAELKLEMQKLSEEKKENLFNRRAYNLQRELNIGDKELMKFIQTAAKVGIDLLSTPTDFKEIYNTVMAPQDTTALTAKDQEILELKKQIALLKGEKAPEEGPGKTKNPANPDDWEGLIANMKGK